MTKKVIIIAYYGIIQPDSLLGFDPVQAGLSCFRNLIAYFELQATLSAFSKDDDTL